jgi:hypothetical protein
MQQVQSTSSEREKILERRIHEIEERFQKLQESLNLNSSTKGKGRGKKSTSARLSEADISEQV